MHYRLLGLVGDLGATPLKSILEPPAPEKMGYINHRGVVHPMYEAPTKVPAKLKER